MGLLGVYRRHIKNFSQQAKPIYDLLKEENGKVGEKKNVRSSRNPVQWTSEHQKALESLIDQITSPPILAYPEYDAPFIVTQMLPRKALGKD